MKKIYLLSFILIFNHSFSQSFDVRNCKWGMSIDEVRNAEGILPTSETKDVIGLKNGEYIYSDKIVATYDIVIDNKPVKLFYYFKNNALVSATLTTYWSNFYPTNDHSNTSRLNQFKNIFRSIISEKHYIMDKFLITGIYYSDSYLKSNRFCFSKEPFKYYDNTDIQRVVSCVDSYFKTSREDNWGFTMTNNRTNILIHFPSINYKGETSDLIIGWIKYEPKNKSTSNDY